MNKIQDRLQVVLGDFERQVLSLLAEAASEGNFDAIESSKSVAFAIRRIREDLGQTELEFRSQAGSLPTQGAGGAHRASPSESRGPRPKGFPKFEVADGSLIKTGWSKKKKATYQQRVPRETFERVVTTLSDLAKDQKVAPTEVIMERVEAGIPGLPSYQTYAVLAFLRSNQAIRSAGRGEYVLEPDVGEQAKRAWESISGPGE